MRQKILYRPDIDGIRFISVLAVFLYHLKIPQFTGGYLGVDIFFVISGFLITKFLYKKTSWEDLLFFLLNRAKRLLPTLFLISFITLFLSYFFIPQIFRENNIINFFSSILGFSNIIFTIQNLGYFYNNDYNPFLHTWSLSLEIQFYIFFSFFLFLFSNVNRNIKFFLILGITIFFFLLNLDYSQTTSLYYSPIRFFEFGLGSIIVFFNFNLNSKLKNLFSSISLLLIFYSILFFNVDKAIPGYWVLLPCISTCVFILSEKSFLNILIGNKLFSFLGRLSYSIYLIHFPVIIFFSFIFFIDDFIKILIIFFTLITSIFVHFCFEKPIRNNFHYFKIFVLIYLLSSLLIIGNLDKIKNFKKSINKYEKIYINNLKLRNTVEQKIIVPKRSFNNFNADILIVGDSYSEDLYMGLIYNGIQENRIQLSRLEIFCYKKNLDQRALLSKIINPNKINICRTQLKNLENHLKSKNIKLIIVANNWSSPLYRYELSLSNLEIGLKTILNLSYGKKIVIIKNNIIFDSFEEFVFKNSPPYIINKYLFKQQSKYPLIANNLLKEISVKYNLYYFDYELGLCSPLNNSCKVINEESSTLSHNDRSHYSSEILEEISKLLIKDLNLFKINK